ncbi:hypothetical protein FK216_15400 [Moraxellaceae bacterium AER2_44_116]|nr:hypothetical protein FK216_15400 [Moraxellaceae bacterium AER2_44_116]
MTATVTLQVNQSRLIGNLKHSFTNQSTFLSELMQNARRAGASEVRFEFHAPHTLVVIDNGHGIDNLQNLLTIAESGWDEVVCNEERPFGMGFMAALFASDKVTVSSHNKCLSFHREDAIQQRPIQIEPCDFQHGTRIVLDGITLSYEALRGSIKSYTRGFSIPVYFNDELCLCEHSWEHLITQPLLPSFEAYGEVLGLGNVIFDVNSVDLECYLLGIPIYRDYVDIYSYRKPITVIHLDPKHFIARSPDRDCLYDLKGAVSKIKDGIKNWWIQRIQLFIGVLSDEQIIQRYWKVMKHWGLYELMNQIKAVPAHLFGRLEGVPECLRAGRVSGSQYRLQEGSVITLNQLKSGHVKICTGFPEYMSKRNMIPAVIATIQGWLVLLNAYDIPHDHWLHGYLIHLSNENGSVDFEQLGSEPFYSHMNSDLEVKLCESLVLNWQGHSCTTSDYPVVYEEDDLHIAVVPKNMKARSVLLMADSYVYSDESDLLDVELEIDTEELSILLSSMQHTEPADLLKTILGDRLNLPSARGATLLISVSNTGQLVTTNVTELLKASDGELAMLLSSLTQEQAEAA